MIIQQTPNPSKSLDNGIQLSDSPGVVLQQADNLSFLMDFKNPNTNFTNCQKCDQPIFDRFFMCIGNQIWHQDCLRCNSCGLQLNQKCYVRAGNFYCKDDFLKFFGPKCNACLSTLKPTDLVRLAKGLPFHLHCFNCFECQRQFITGDECYLDQDSKRVLCKDHFQTGINVQTLLTNLSPPRSIGTDQGHETKFDINKSSDSNVSPSIEDSLTGKLFVSLARSVDITSKAPQKSPNSTSEEIKKPPIGTVVSLKSSATESRGSTEPDDQLNFFDILNTSESEKSSRNQEAGVSDNTDEEEEEILEEADEDYSEEEEDGSGNGSLMMLGSDGSLPSGYLEGGMMSGIGSSESGRNNSTGLAQGVNGTKRRGPRTTIKAKQLDTLKASFTATPKPTRHVREQLAQETGLSMRVIQVWFQNRRSKERRMKQLNVLGNRRQFYRSPRRMRGFRPPPNGIDEFNSVSTHEGLIPPNPNPAEILNNPVFNGFFVDNPANTEFFNNLPPSTNTGLLRPNIESTIDQISFMTSSGFNPSINFRPSKIDTDLPPNKRFNLGESSSNFNMDELTRPVQDNKGHFYGNGGPNHTSLQNLVSNTSIMESSLSIPQLFPGPGSNMNASLIEELKPPHLTSIRNSNGSNPLLSGGTGRVVNLSQPW